MIDEMITGILVCWNTQKLVERAFYSVRKFHPHMPIFIIDGSDKRDPCYKYVERLANDDTLVHHAGYNIGHGRGMALGLSAVFTPFALMLDSDIEMLKSPVAEMMAMVEEDTLAVGWIEDTDFGGFEWGSRPGKPGPMNYMHPYFMLLQVKEYRKYLPVIHHGAPFVDTMRSVHDRGMSGRALKEFPGLGHTSGKGWVWEGKPSEYIRHDIDGFGGTGRERAKRGLPHIEGEWEQCQSAL